MAQAQIGKKKRSRRDWNQWKNDPETHALMRETEKEMAQETSSIFSTEDFIGFLENKFNVSILFYVEKNSSAGC